MLSAPEVLGLASLYDFETVKNYLDSGGNPKIYDGYGHSLLTALLSGYYDVAVYGDPDEKQLVKAHEKDDVFNSSHVNKWCKIRLADRPHSIVKQVTHLLDNGIGINAVGWDEATAHQKYAPCVETPLFQAIINRDYYMTEFLLQHGADPCMKLFTDGEYDLYGYESWLIDDLDIAISSGACGEACQHDLDMAVLLLQYGLDQWERGYSIERDTTGKGVRLR